MQQRAMFVGNSDGIGLATTKRLLETGWNVIGISRSESPISNAAYHHLVADVCDQNYSDLVYEVVRKNSFDLCIYFAGIGEQLNTLDMRSEAKIFNVNLTGMVKTAAAIVPQMVKKGHGHFIGLSSLADELLSAEAPSYHASKAGFSNYLGGLALALKPKGVYVTNIRLGFVNTKMAKGDVKPFMMSVDKAVEHIESCIIKKPFRYTTPKVVIPLIKFRKLMLRFSR